MAKLFLAQFFNTAINLLVIAASFPWLKRYFEGTVRRASCSRATSRM